MQDTPAASDSLLKAHKKEASAPFSTLETESQIMSLPNLNACLSGHRMWQDENVS